jgi:peptidoglycan glycosyltransferase
MEDALQMSCNTAFAGIGMALGADALEAQAEKFGVGTAFTLAGKGDTAMKSVKTSILQSDDPNYKRSLDKVGLASIGQGEDNFTVLQDALISAAVANGGVLMNPYLVENVYDSQNDLVEKTKPTEFSRAVSTDTANKLRDMMIRVTHPGGSVPNMQIPGIEVAAKTGTAQEETHEVPDAWITTFAPAANPKIALAVFIQDGEDDPTGASAAALVAKEILLAAGVGNVDK